MDGGDRGELRRDFVGLVGRERELEKADAGNLKFGLPPAPVHEHRHGDRYSAVGFYDVYALLHAAPARNHVFYD